MTFGAPWSLLLLILAAAGLVSVGWWARWRARVRTSVAGSSTGQRADRVTYLAAPLVVVAAVALAGLAAARPQIGERTQRSEERGIDVAIVLDVSRSMDAADVAASRLKVAQDELSLLVGGLEGDRVGLVIFAGEPLIRSPLTSDVAALQGLLRTIDQERGLLPLGSDLGAGIEAGRRLLEDGEARSKAMVVATDGEDFGTTLEFAVARAARAGIEVHVLGVGTVEGGPVVDTDADTGATTPRLGADGGPVITRLVEQTLVSVAEAGAGEYALASSDGSAAGEIGDRLADLRATTFAVRSTSLPIERFQIVAAVALLLAVAELLWRPVAAVASRQKWARWWPLAAPVVFLGGICTASVADINDEGNEAYEQGAYARSLDLYRTAAVREPHGEIAYNASNALQHLGQHEEAIEQARRALDDLIGSAAAEYALGSHLAADGQFAAAFEAFKRALLIDPGDFDSKHNLEVVSILLTPTAEVTQAPPEGTPTAGGGDDGSPGGAASPSGGTAVPDQSSNNATQAALGTPSGALPGEDELSDDDLERAIEDALAGIDEEFTTDEALQLLRLLDEQNRRSLADTSGDTARPGQPDY